MHSKAFYLFPVFCVFSCLFVATNSGCKRPGPAASGRQVLRISQRNEPADLDPATANLPDEFFIIRALSEGLVVPAPVMARPPLPAAAERWDVSPDGLVYTFHLRAGARWSDGEPVTAADFVASYRRLLTPATAAPKAALFYAVRNARAFAAGEIADFSSVGFRAADAGTLVVTLAHPTPRFLDYVASGPWIPVDPRTVARYGRDWTRPGNFVGNGPFTLAEWRPHQRIVVRKNPAYRDAAQVRLDEIQFIAFDSGDTEERAYRTGQVDVTMDVPIAKLDPYARERPAELHRGRLAETRYLTFNTARPPLDDRRVRQALSGAIDRRRLVQLVLRGGQRVPDAFAPIDDLYPERAADLQGLFAFQPDNARQLLAAAGFPGGKNFPRLELSSWRVQASVLEAIQQMWKENLGIEVGLAVRDAKVHVAALRSGSYDIGFITSIPDVADEYAILADFITGAPGNYPHWSNALYDESLARAAAAFSDADRIGPLRKAEELLDRECPVTPLYFNAHNWLMSPRVRGWQEDALWNRSYSGIYLEGN